MLLARLLVRLAWPDASSRVKQSKKFPAPSGRSVPGGHFLVPDDQKSKPLRAAWSRAATVASSEWFKTLEDRRRKHTAIWFDCLKKSPG